jgi:hypothetical protein
LEIYTNFLEYNEKRKSKNPPHSVGPASAHGFGTFGLAHDHFSLAGPATQRGRGVRSAVTASMAITVVRPGRSKRDVVFAGNGAH